MPVSIFFNNGNNVVEVLHLKGHLPKLTPAAYRVEVLLLMLANILKDLNISKCSLRILSQPNA